MHETVEEVEARTGRPYYWTNDGRAAHKRQYPERYEIPTRDCPVCGADLDAIDEATDEATGGNARWTRETCSNACRQKAYRLRRKAAQSGPGED
jgi:hypothetical protein